MSLYNMVNGANPATFFILPMLGKHPDEYPRFRDCFVNDEDHPEYSECIIVYTRVGGGNRDDYEDAIESLRDMDGFVADYDDDFDSTYASFVFNVPDRWKSDYNKILSGDIKGVSSEYQNELRRVYPKLSDKFDELFGKRG